tara:strand:- start:512 stop:1492 length:981 start_codon:yes stop_codon:yes gene_type:complete
MPGFKTIIITRAKQAIEKLQDGIEYMRGHNRFVRADFDDGGKTLHSYLSTHRNKYYRHVGAHFLVALYEAGPEIFQGFAEKQRKHGWHFDLTHEESEALKRARDITCTHTRIANLRYTTNVFEQIANKKQLMRMLGLGAVAGSAGILLGLGELFFFFKETAKKLSKNVLGLNLDGGSAENDNAQFVELAKEITAEAVNPDGTLDAEQVAIGIENLVMTLEEAGSAETAVNAMNGNITYIIGILTGIIFLVVGRGLVQLILEGLNGAMSKIDALVCDMDDYANWKLGRSPFPPAAKELPGDLILPDRSTLLHPKDFSSSFRVQQTRI